MSASPQSRWSAESVSIIKTMAGEGRSGKEIAHQFGVSRSAILGLCFRNAISLGGAGTRRQKYVANSNLPTLAQKRKEARQRRAVRLKAPEAFALPAAPVAPPEGILLTDLARNMCRWPVTTALPHRFCGAHANGTYCEHHHSRAYRGFE